MPKKFKKIILVFCLLVAVFAVAHFAVAGTSVTGWGEAGTGGDAASFQANTGLANTDPRVVAARIIRIALGFLGIIAVGLIIYAGWLWMTAGGEPDKIEKAKKILIGAVIGLIIILSAFAIASFILSRLLDATGGGGDGNPPGGGGGGQGRQSTYGSDMTGTTPENGDTLQPINTTVEFFFRPGVNIKQKDSSGGFNNLRDKTQANSLSSYFKIENFSLFKPVEAATDDKTTGTLIESADKPLDPLALNNNFKLEKIGNINPKSDIATPIPACEVAGVRSLDPSQTIYKFKSKSANSQDERCKQELGESDYLPKWSQFKATINEKGGIISIGGEYFTCEEKKKCEIIFSTGEYVDKTKPQAGIVSTQICKDDGAIEFKPEANLVTGWGSDDDRVSYLSFYQQKLGGADKKEELAKWQPASLRWINPIPNNGQQKNYQQAQYKFDTRKMAKDENYKFLVYANDGADNISEAASFTAVIRPGHCCNGQKDPGETDTDCGGECGACVGQACAQDMSKPLTCDNSVCASSFCTTQSSDLSSCQAGGYGNNPASCCLCQRQPIITGVSPLGGFCSNDNNKYCQTNADCGQGNKCNANIPNGAVGNFVTISGRDFGETQGRGKVFFGKKNSADPVAPADWIEAKLASAINVNCSKPWQDDQIVAVVPDGTAGGPIKIVTDSGFYDTTNDYLNGPPLDDFLVNTIKRPGLCSAVNTVKERNNKDNECFNESCGYFNDAFQVQGNAFSGSSRSILFGNTQKFVSANAIDWKDNLSAGAKIPNIQDGGTSVFAKVNNVNSNYLSFNVKDDPNMNPVISYVDPAKGPVGQYLTIYGRNFKTYDAQKSKVEFYLPRDSTNLIPADIDFAPACRDNWWHDTYIVVKVPKVDKSGKAVALGDYKAVVTNIFERTSPPADFTVNNDALKPGLCSLVPDNGPIGWRVSVFGERFGSDQGKVEYYNDKSATSLGDWTDIGVDSNVPIGAVTGPVEVINSAGTVSSNSLPFKVGKCSASSECESGDECCGAGTYWSGICRPAETCAIGAGVECAYGWQFTAKYTPPGVGEPCFKDATKENCSTKPPECDPSLVCSTDMNCTCQPSNVGDPCDGDTATQGCQANQNKCGNNLICNSSTCKCEPIQIDKPCYPSGSPGKCDRDKNLCANAGLKCDWDKCTCKLPEGVGGESCKIDNVAACSTGVGSCDASAGYACLNKDAADCRCCCQPGVSPDKTVGNVTLKCVKNQSPCDGENRGLYCGCTNDSQCGAVGSGLGCGTDGCCHKRPEVISTAPADGAGVNDDKKVCRNALIQATFSEAMQLNTFTNNVIVLGDYELKTCPAGTEYLTKDNPPLSPFVKGARMLSFLAKVRRLLENIPLVNKLIVKNAEAVAGNFCVVKGTVSGYDNAAKNQSTLEFRPDKVLDPDRKYYVIIKGETNDQDAVKDGVLSLNNIGMNSINQTFNGVSFNGHIWSFTTKEANSADSGICQISTVRINPASHLFNQSPSDPTVKNLNKDFQAMAYSADNQIIAQQTGLYNWRWDWRIDNQAVVNFTGGNPTNNSKQTLTAQNIEDGHTLVHAKATVIEDAVAMSAGQSKEGLAEVYVFLCENPWPPYKKDKDGNLIWQPWQDESNNCGAENKNNCGPNKNKSCCYTTNSEFYYCRDSGRTGTATDLPAILSDNAIIRGAEGDIFKEFYFFREDLPTIAQKIATSTPAEGNKVGLTWDPIAPQTGKVIDKYIIYYGTQPKKYTKSAEATIPLQPGPFYISNLTNGIKYYFAVTAHYTTGAEGAYSNEVWAVPADTLKPNTPIEIFVSQKDATSAYVIWPVKKMISKNIATGEIKWDDNKDTVSYKVYYGASLSFGAVLNVNKNKCSDTACAVTVPNLHPGAAYHFAVAALDTSGNESVKIESESLFISNQAGVPENLELAPINFTSASGTALLSWAANRDQTTSYKIYYRQISYTTKTGSIVANNEALKSAAIGKDKCSSTVCVAAIDGLDIGGRYTFEISAIDGKSIESSTTTPVKYLKIDRNDKTLQCRADLINILATIGRKRDELNKPLSDITGEYCSDCCCRTDFINSPYCQKRTTTGNTACVNDMSNAFKKLGYSDVQRDPWGDPYYINEDEYEINYFLINDLTPLCGRYTKGPDGAIAHDELRSINAACGGMTGGVKVPNYYCPN